MTTNTPLVSICCIIKNAAPTLARPLRSLLAQDYDNIEIILQDGNSTDDTLEVVREFYDHFKGKLYVESVPDLSGEDGYFKALKRCRGDIIGTCLADEELMPDACSWAVRNFAQSPEFGGIYGDVYGTDLAGNITSAEPFKEDFSFVKYICHEQVPPFSSTFFNRRALDAIGFCQYPWLVGCGEFEFWLRMASKFPVGHRPGFVSKFASHPGSKSSQAKTYIDQIPMRKKVIERFFSADTTPPEIKKLKNRCLSGMHCWVAQTFNCIGELDLAAEQLNEAAQYDPDLNLDRWTAIYHETMAKINARIAAEGQASSA